MSRGCRHAGVHGTRAVARRDAHGAYRGVYTLGLVFYELFLGAPALRQPDNRQASSGQDDVPTLEFTPDLDIRVVHAIPACLAADPNRRPSSV